MRIEIRLTQRCNFNCHYCTDLHNNNVEHIPFDFNAFEKMIPQFSEPEVFIYGGEPTTHPDCKRLTDYLSEKNISTTLQTNASNRRVLKTINPHVKINCSYHSSIMTLQRFMHNITGLNINEIAFMADAPDREYYILKAVFKDKVQYCPIINDKLNDYSFNQELRNIAERDIFKDVQEDYHFRPHENGITNYDVWYNNIDSIGVDCDIKKKMIHVQDNKVYFCFNALMKDENGVPMADFVNTYETVTCPYKKCYFGMENWVI
jgi:organic radical activating enzyme